MIKGLIIEYLVIAIIILIIRGLSYDPTYFIVGYLLARIQGVERG